jgi:hypothetical protein
VLSTKCNMMRDKEIEETETGIQCQNITKRVSWHSSLELRATPGRSSPCALGLCDKILPALLLHLPSVLVCGQTYFPLADLRPRLTDLLARTLALLTYDLVFLAARGLGLKTGEAAKRGSSLSCSKATAWSTNATLALLAERTFFFSEDAGGV